MEISFPYPYGSLDEIKKYTHSKMGDFSEEDEATFDTILKSCSIGTYDLKIFFKVRDVSATKDISFYYLTERESFDCYFRITLHEKENLLKFNILTLTIGGYISTPFNKNKFTPDKSPYYEKRLVVQTNIELQKQVEEQKAYIERLEAQVKDMREHIESTPGGEFFLEAMEDFLNRKHSLEKVKK